MGKAALFFFFMGNSPPKKVKNLILNLKKKIAFKRTMSVQLLPRSKVTDTHTLCKLFYILIE